MAADTLEKAVLPASNPKQLLTAQQLGPLNHRSNALGSLRLLWHLSVLVISGCIWSVASGFVAVAALIVYGASLALTFCAVHECAHRTAFASNRANDAIAWLLGLFSLYNSTFYRQYHKWHHRYTRIEGKDPELLDLEPQTIPEYLWVLSGIPWWIGKLTGHTRVALGKLEGCYYLPESSHQRVIQSTRLQLGAYGAIFLLSAALGHPGFLFTYWILPLAVGQPLLRFVLLAEHTGCTYDDNALANTRTTLTLWPLRSLMWNMPYHAEHHLYPSVPFHALPQAHSLLKEHFSTVDSGYVRVNQEIVHGFS
ncbi:MAG: fatty acid desaturase [Cyanobacteria bacterium P01_D01_bin.105]